MKKSPNLTVCSCSLPSGFFRMLIPLLAICILFMACSRGNDAEEIRKHIAKGAALAEAHETGTLLQLATDDIRAMPMNLDRRGIKGVLWQSFKRYGSFAVLYPRPTIEIAENAGEASTHLPFLIVKKTFSLPGLEELRDHPLAWVAAVGDVADLYSLRLQWVKQDGGWLVELAFLERFDGLGFE